MRPLVVLVLVLSAHGVAAEEQRPDPSYFTGVYERVGRDAASPPGLIDDLLRIEPAAEGWGIVVRSCTALAEPVEQMELRPGEYDEVPNMIEGQSGPFAVWCQYFNDHSNYPILTCASEMGARFTLWAVTDERAASCAP